MMRLILSTIGMYLSTYLRKLKISEQKYMLRKTIERKWPPYRLFVFLNVNINIYKIQVFG